MTDEQLLEYRRVKLLGRDKQVAKLLKENSKLREDLEKEINILEHEIFIERILTRAMDKKTISLRDHFAGLAMQEFLALNKFKTALIIDMAYVMADAMLAERSKRDE